MVEADHVVVRSAESPQDSVNEFEDPSTCLRFVEHRRSDRPDSIVTDASIVPGEEHAPFG
jgi:hypothetical protein